VANPPPKSLAPVVQKSVAPPLPKRSAPPVPKKAATASPPAAPDALPASASRADALASRQPTGTGAPVPSLEEPDDVLEEPTKKQLVPADEDLKKSKA
jgi:hypothetical protein